MGPSQCYELLSIAGQALRSAAQGQEWEGHLPLQTGLIVSLHHFLDLRSWGLLCGLRLTLLWIA